ADRGRQIAAVEIPLAGDARLLIARAGDELPGVGHGNGAVAKTERDGVGRFVGQRAGGLIRDGGDVAVLGPGGCDAGAVELHLDAEYIQRVSAIDDVGGDRRINFDIGGVLSRANRAHVGRLRPAQDAVGFDGAGIGGVVNDDALAGNRIDRVQFTTGATLGL